MVRSLAVKAVLALGRRSAGSSRRKPCVRLSLASDRLTLRELIERAVELEASKADAEKLESCRAIGELLGVPKWAFDPSLVTVPSKTQRLERAFRAFDAGAFSVLLDGRRLDSLDEVLTVSQNSEILFVRRTALRGG